MKNWVLTLLLACGVCALSFGSFYVINREPPGLRKAAREGDAMEWLRVEFRLTDAQYAAITQLHAKYGVTCNEHCSRIMAAEKRGAPRAEISALENECVRSMTEHFRAVAALMAPKQGERYLALVMPRIHDYDHRGAPDVEVRR
jgi:hypothetical protein